MPGSSGRLTGRPDVVSRAHQVLNLTGVLLPFLGFLVAIVLLWDKLVDWTSLAIFAGMYVLTVEGVTLGFHRLLTHRSFQTYKPVQYALAIVGSMAVQGPVMNWVADHRKHHAHTDQEGDPHTPARPRQRRQGRGRRPLVRAHGLAVRALGHERARALRPRSLRGPRDAAHPQDVRACGWRSGSCSRRCSGWSSPAPGGARSRRRCGAAPCGSSSAITSPGRSTPSVTSSGRGGSPSTITRPTSSGSRCSRWASPGTTTTTRSRARPSTGCASGSWTRPRGRSASMRRVKLAWNVVEITPERQREKLA